MEQPLHFKARRGPFLLEKHRKEAKRVRDRKRRERLRARGQPLPATQPPAEPAPQLTEDERLAKLCEPTIYAEPKLREDQ